MQLFKHHFGWIPIRQVFCADYFVTGHIYTSSKNNFSIDLYTGVLQIEKTVSSTAHIGQGIPLINKSVNVCV